MSATSCCMPSSEPCCTLTIEGFDQERLVRMFKALGNPLRFEILKYLLTHPGCITGDIVDVLPISQATVSQHLKVMREAGLVIGRIDGPARCYCLDTESLAWFRAQIEANF
jgi:ArsR family transcriptional regulator, arsenate/arsenite/antimonite-responsive transcriptional repressor